mmetsp:Transcript_40448/g.129928  ORF Transcript_40448/g.129928 Transcript_40448/m.129928 type:complete len:206 (-) Transcript_40448:7-624(-)
MVEDPSQLVHEQLRVHWSCPGAAEAPAVVVETDHPPPRIAQSLGQVHVIVVRTGESVDQHHRRSFRSLNRSGALVHHVDPTHGQSDHVTGRPHPARQPTVGLQRQHAKDARPPSPSGDTRAWPATPEEEDNQQHAQRSSNMIVQRERAGLSLRNQPPPPQRRAAAAAAARRGGHPLLAHVGAVGHGHARGEGGLRGAGGHRCVQA